MQTLQCRAAAAAPRASLRTQQHAMVGLSLPRSPLRAALPQRARQVTVNGLFGLGVPELAVIAGVAAIIFGEAGGRAGRPLGGRAAASCRRCRL